MTVRTIKVQGILPLLSIATLMLLLVSSFASAISVDALRPVPVLDRGRVKPIDSLARETIRSITGKETFGTAHTTPDGQTSDNRLDPLEMLIAWQSSPETWDEVPLLYVPNIELRKRVGLPETSQWISASTLRSDQSFLQWSIGLMQRQQTAERTRELAHLTPLEDAAILLRNRLATFDAVTSGKLVALQPRAGDAKNAWADLDALATAPTPADTNAPAIVAAWHELLHQYVLNNQQAFDAACKTLDTALAPSRSAANVDTSRVSLEVTYNLLHPFRIVWIGYLCAVALLIASSIIETRLMYRIAMAGFILCVAAHVGAFIIRCRITGWAPVTNMYETVVWVSLVAAVISLVIELITRTRTIAVAGAVTALIASVVADVMPPEMGRQVGTLAPVLRSNYWLTIHVLTIVSSYAAFALACVLGNIALFRFALRGGKPADVTARTVKLTYRAVQIGVLLIAAGTILGGLWADVSWGRFWGWDPKEVWALIVLLTYLTLLHGRFAGHLHGFGFVGGAVACFTTVLMSWYGVNFVLGAGLHSYGFNTGGQGWVATYVVIQLAWVVVARVLWRASLRDAGGAPLVPAKRHGVTPSNESADVIVPTIGAQLE